MKLRHTMVAVTLAAALPALAAAQSLAVPERIPADALAVVSINDTNTMWGNLAASPLAEPIKKALQLPALQEGMGELTAALKAAEASVGFPVTADSILGDKVTGVDVYMLPTPAGAQTASVAQVFEFKNEADAKAVVDALVKQLSTDAVSATTSEVGGSTLHSFPDQNMHIAQAGNVVVAGTFAEAATGALTSNGKAALLEGESFAKSMGPLASRTHQMWAFGDGDKISETMSSVLPPEAQNSMGGLKGQVIAAVLEFDKDFIKITGFTPKDNFTGVQKVSLENVSGSDLKAAAFLPGNSLIAYTFNYLNAANHWKAAIDDSAKAGPEAQMALGMIQGSLAGSEQTLGFSVFDELMPALGNNLGVSVNRLAFNPMIQPPIDADLTLVAQAKDIAKVTEILGKLETSVTSTLKEQLMMSGMTPPADFSAFKGSEYAGNTLRVMSPPEGFDQGVPFLPAYTLTKDGFFVFGLSEKGVQEALDRAAGKGETFTSSSTFTRGQQLFDSNRNAVTSLNFVGISQTATALLGLFGAGMPPEQMQATQAALEVMNAMGNLYMTSTYSDQGQLTEVVTVMK